MPDLAPRRWWSSFAVLAALLAAISTSLISTPGTQAPERFLAEQQAPERLLAQQQGPGPAPIQAVFPDGVTWTPPTIFSDEPVLVEIRISGGDFTHVFIDTRDGTFPTDTTDIPGRLNFFVPPITEVLQLFDDGTRGDAVPGDNVWSRSGITVNPAVLTHDGGTHQSVNMGGLVFFDEPEGSAQTFGQIGNEDFFALRVVNANQRGLFPATDLGGGLFATSHALFLEDPSFFPNPAEAFNGDEMDVCRACQILIEQFGDVFDFIMLQGVDRLAGTLADEGALAFHSPRSNEVAGIGLDIFSQNQGPIQIGGSPFNTFSDGRLRGTTYNNAPSGSPLTHEIMHQWTVWPAEMVLPYQDGTGHYLNNSDIVGIMDTGVDAFSRPGESVPSDFFANGDDTFRLVTRPGSTNATFSTLILYLAGFLDAAQVPPITIFGTIDLNDPDQVIVGNTVTVTVEDVIATFGPRDPSRATSPKDFQMSTLVVSDRSVTAAEFAWFSLVLRYFASDKAYDGFGPPPWRAATLGVSTITTALPGLQQPEPEPQPEGDTFTAPIVHGFNLLGWMGGTSIEEATDTLQANFETIFAFDPILKLFNTYSPAAPSFLNDLDELEAGMGMWVLSDGPGEWEMPVPDAPLSIQLRTGFNLVVWSGEHAIATVDAIASLGSALEALFVWDSINQRFLSFSPSAPAFLNDATVLFFGEGVWVQVNRNVTWDQGG